MSGNACLKCGSPATKTYTLYDYRTDVHQDVPLCESCYSSYTSVLKKGKLVWKRSGLVTYYPPFFFAIGSRRAPRRPPGSSTGSSGSGSSESSLRQFPTS